MIYLGNDTMNKVERMVCEQVNTAMSTEEKEGVNADDLYVGNTNIPFARAVARNFVLDVLHNRYGFSYAVIAQRADINEKSAMRCVRKCHELVGYDKTYAYVNTFINDRLREWYGE